MSSADFDAAVKYVATATDMKATDDDKLRFYKFYKQATVGDCNTTKPGLFQLQQKYKWEAWDSLKGMPREEAMSNYVALLDRLVPSWRS
ncbi:acyl-CoA-binding protein [Babesia caballi]|uniref:Acyl-CoA-binding protein n=1 Tax=Babesia caballi TaxID=5871 RepID=A0AAV4M1D1_BABCB|nr:acyl-CoA-binding protein [Babesia caballi]